MGLFWRRITFSYQLKPSSLSVIAWNLENSLITTIFPKKPSLIFPDVDEGELSAWESNHKTLGSR